MEKICLITSYEPNFGNNSIFNQAEKCAITDLVFLNKLNRHMPKNNFFLLKCLNEDLFGFYSHNEWRSPIFLLKNHVYSILLEISKQKEIELAEMLNKYIIYLILHDKDIFYPHEQINSNSCVKELVNTEFTQYFIKYNPDLVGKNINNLHVYVFKHMGGEIEKYLLLKENKKSQTKIDTLIEIIENRSGKDEQKAQLNLKLEFLHNCLLKTGIKNAREKINALIFNNFPTEIVSRKHLFKFKNKENQKLLEDMLNFLEKPEYDCLSSEYIDVLSSMRDCLLLENSK